MTSFSPRAQFPPLCKRLPNVCTALVLTSCPDFTNLSSPRSLTINAQWTSQPTYIPIFMKSLSLSFSSHPVNGCIWNLYLDQWTHLRYDCLFISEKSNMPYNPVMPIFILFCSSHCFLDPSHPTILLTLATT